MDVETACQETFEERLVVVEIMVGFMLEEGFDHVIIAADEFDDEISSE